MLAIRVYSETNPWVDCVVFVHDDILEGQAFEAIQKGMDEWNEEDSDLCWGDAITTALSEAGVPHSIVYGDLNEDETDTTPAWDEFVRILAKDGDIPVSLLLKTFMVS